MIKITSTEIDDGVNFEVEDETEDFDQLGMELATLIRYAYDSVYDAASQGGARDPEREAQLYIDSIVNDAINGDIAENGEDAQRRERGQILRLVDDYMDKNKKDD